jgi:molybdenum cofactor cytidylyltransferase
MIPGIVLAAGKSERMGSPKALLRIRGETFIEGILRAIDQSPLDFAITVVGHHRDEILKEVRLDRWAYNPDYEMGMTTSLQVGIRALGAGVDGAMLFLVDHPRVTPGVIEELLLAFQPGEIAVPVWGGRRGHPVLFSRTVLDEILELGPSEGANLVVRRDRARVRHVEVEDPGILDDIDTPDAYRRLEDG